MAKANKTSGAKGSNKGNKGSSSKAQATPSAVVTLPPIASKYLGAKLPTGLTAPAGYVPTQRGVLIAVARAAKTGQPVAVPEYGRVRTKQCPWGPNTVTVLAALQKLGAGQGHHILAIAQTAGLSQQQCRHQLLHGQAAGITSVQPNGRAYLYGITAHGVACHKAGKYLPLPAPKAKP